MKKVIRILAIILVVIITGTSLTACSKNKEQITNLLAEFEYSCNTLDVEAILNCIIPSTSDKIKLALGIYGLIADKDTAEVLDDISESLIGDSSLDGNDFFSSIQIETENIKVDGEEAAISASVTYKINGETFHRMADFRCVYYMEKWYIANFSFV